MAWLLKLEILARDRRRLFKARNVPSAFRPPPSTRGEVETNSRKKNRGLRI